MKNDSRLLSEGETRRVKPGRHGGFALVESILIVVFLVGIGFAIYYLGFGAKGKADERALAQDIDTMQKAVDMYYFVSDGRYPTEDGKRPQAAGEYKLIVWQASFINEKDQTVYFYSNSPGQPTFITRLPNHWDEGVWRIDSNGGVSANVDPGIY